MDRRDVTSIAASIGALLLLLWLFWPKHKGERISFVRYSFPFSRSALRTSFLSLFILAWLVYLWSLDPETFKLWAAGVLVLAVLGLALHIWEQR